MKLGLLGTPLSRRQRPLAETFEVFASTIERADTLGFTEVFIGEHHTSWNLPIAAPLSFLAALAPRTSQIRLGTGVLALPYSHPARLAGEIAQLDHLTAGRLNLGIGPGGLIPDMELFGMLDTETRMQTLRDSLSAILDVWQSEAPFSVARGGIAFGVTEHVDAELGLGNLLRPYQEPHPPIFVTALSPRSESLRWSVENGWNPISAHFSSRETLRAHGEELLKHQRALDDEPTLEHWRVARHVVVRESDAAAEDAVFATSSATRFAVSFMWEILRAGELTETMKPTRSMPDDEVTLESLLSDLVIFGTPASVRDQLGALRESIGDFGTLLIPLFDGTDQENAGELETMNLLATLSDSNSPRVNIVL